VRIVSGHPSDPSARTTTIRESLAQVLKREECTALDLSKAVGIPERDVADHLQHLEKSLRARGQRLERRPSRCLECDFEFTKRRRMNRPSACPRCRSRRLSLPRFRVI